jgi:hypothetical protein
LVQRFTSVKETQGLKKAIGIFIFAVGLAFSQPPAKDAPVLPSLTAEDAQLVNQLMNPPEIAAVRADLEKTQALANALQGQLNALYTIQAMRLNSLTQSELPAKYKLSDYVWDTSKGWVKKQAPPVAKP